MSPLFVAIEGPTTIGKTTLAVLLAAQLTAASGRPTRVLTEPLPYVDYQEWLTGRPLALTHAARRYVDVDQVVIPSLDAGVHVIADGYLESALVWHRIDGMETGEVWRYHTYLLEPHVTLCLRDDPDRLASRRLMGRPRAARLEAYAPPSRQLSYYRDARRLMTRHGWHHHGVDCTDRTPQDLADLMMAYLAKYAERAWGHRVTHDLS